MREPFGFLAAGLLWGSLLICCPCPVCAAGSAGCLSKGVHGVLAQAGRAGAAASVVSS